MEPWLKLRVRLVVVGQLRVTFFVRGSRGDTFQNAGTLVLTEHEWELVRMALDTGLQEQIEFDEDHSH